MPLLNFFPPIIAHRGASGYAPENTIVAFTKAAQLGIKWVEFDVMLASCGEPIVFHDEELDRTTDAKGLVGEYPYTYLSTLDAGAWFNAKFAGEKIPNLKQVLEFLRNANMSANVEIKPLPGQDAETAIAALKEIIPFFPQPNPAILFSSFSVSALETLRRHSPQALIGLLLHEWEAGWEEAVTSLQCVSVHVYEEIMTELAAKKIKGMGKYLLCYTVNSRKRAEELFSWGVDAVFSDVPDKLLNIT